MEMPLVMADGKTIAACANALIEATALAIVSILEHGEKPPAPASDRKRDQQLNIRLSAEEKLRLEASAQAEGFASISDYVRSAALRAAG